VESIGGYRIIRRLGSGDRADVLLGHAGHGLGAAPQLAAIKVFHSHVPEASVDAEIGALSRLDHPHIVQLLDLATGPRNEAILILQRLEPGGLPRLLAERGTLDAGEAVTILAPLVAAVGGMHRAGVTHGRVGASAVLFDDLGAPVLCGFGSAGAIEGRNAAVPPAVLDRDAGVLADIGGLSSLAVAVLARVPGAAAHGLKQWLAEQEPATDLLGGLEDRLFALAEPAPVLFDPEPEPRPIPDRFDLGAAFPPARAVTHSAPGPGGPAPAGPGRVTPPRPIARWIHGLSGRVPEWLAPRLGVTRQALRSVRRRVWAVAGAGLAAMAVAFAVVQSPASQETPDPDPTPAAFVGPSDPAVVEGDDPVTAARALLGLRARCLLERSILCLDAVHQTGSAAWQADAARIQDIQTGAELTGDSFGEERAITLIDRMGDSALIALAPDAQQGGNDTASVLMIRTEAGWRIRSLLEGTVPQGG
jgi:hypothetical protein